MKIVMMDIFFEVDIDEVDDFHNNLRFLPKLTKNLKVGKLLANFHDQKNMFYT